MLTARSVIIAVVVVAVISLGAMVVSLMGPFDRQGTGLDTYGTRAGGYRAIFEVLADLGIAVERGLVPPAATADADATLVLWGPQPMLVAVEPTYLENVADWVRRGGRVIVAPEHLTDPSERFRRRVMETRTPGTKKSVLELLGLPPIILRTVNLDGRTSTPVDPDYDDDFFSSPRGRREPAGSPGDWSNPWSKRVIPITSVAVDASGSLEALGSQVAKLEVASELQTLDLLEAEPDGQVTLARAGDDGQVIAAEFQVGEGTVVVVGDPALFENRLIARADNAVLAVRLLGASSGKVVWDEFYHGLTIRGNPFFLLTRGHYAMLALLAVATTAVWVWRQAVYLGPPEAPSAVLRRTLAEYVEAMSRFFHRGAASRRFLLEEVRGGVLRALRRKLNLAPGKETPRDVAAAIARHDPAAARRLLDAVAAADLTLSQHQRLGARETLRTLKGLDDCL